MTMVSTVHIKGTSRRSWIVATCQFHLGYLVDCFTSQFPLAVTLSHATYSTADVCDRTVLSSDHLYVISSLFSALCHSDIAESFREWFSSLFFGETSGSQTGFRNEVPGLSRKVFPEQSLEQGFSTGGTRPPGGSSRPIQGGRQALLEQKNLLVWFLHTLLYMTALILHEYLLATHSLL